MKFYAQLNENKICIGISQLIREVIQSDMIEIDCMDHDKLWKKYENNIWSNEKYEPQSTAPLSDFEQLKTDLEMQKEINDTLILDNLTMQAQIDDLILGQLI